MDVGKFGALGPRRPRARQGPKLPCRNLYLFVLENQ